MKPSTYLIMAACLFVLFANSGGYSEARIIRDVQSSTPGLVDVPCDITTTVAQTTTTAVPQSTIATPLTDDGLPFWAIALIVVGVLALIAGVAATCYVFRETILGFFGVH